MSGVTPVYSLPYQTANDSPNGPALGQDLAEAVETELVRIDTDVADLQDAWVTDTAAGQTPSTSETTLHTAALLVASGEKVNVVADLIVNANGANRNCTVRLKRGGVTQQSIVLKSGADSQNHKLNWDFVETPGAGTITYTITTQMDVFTAAIPSGSQLRARIVL